MSPLTPIQRQGAALVAAEVPTTDVANALDVNKVTVRGWMGKEEFQLEVDRVSRELDTELEPMLKTARREVIDAGREAISTLKELLVATNKDGRPSNNVRAAAAIQLSSYLMKVLAQSQDADEGKGGEGGATFNNTKFEVVINPESGAMTVSTADKKPDAIEGTATEE